MRTVAGGGGCVRGVAIKEHDVSFFGEKYSNFDYQVDFKKSKIQITDRNISSLIDLNNEECKQKDIISMV